jgi:hypothetical protein
MINTKLQNIIDTKSAIGNAIVNKGGTITSETPFFNYAAQIDGISTGTPQTIFQASDGSKWALTNVVNLTNVSDNVTYDFNRWQPANNSTSDPILNIGTVGANISGNIRIVQVNQVNIAQYVNLVATDTDGAKYEGFNGFDFNTNPTPTGNTTFNRWLLNNSATGTVIFANATFTTGTYNGPNVTANVTNMAFINNTANYGGTIRAIVVNNGFIYAGGDFGANVARSNVRKYNESTLAFNTNATDYLGQIFALTSNNGFIYAGGTPATGVNRGVTKFHEGNLALSGANLNTSSTANYGGQITSITTNNGFLYAVGESNQTIQKFGEDNRVRVGNSVAYGGFTVSTMAINDGYIYIGGSGNVTSGRDVKKYYESNLVFLANTFRYTDSIDSITINNGFVYATGRNNLVSKFHESNLVLVGNTANIGGSIIPSITTNGGFIYVVGSDNFTVQKFYESNLAFVGNTTSYGGSMQNVTTNNGFIYVGGITTNTVYKYQEQSVIPDNQTFYTATKIKE